MPRCKSKAVFRSKLMRAFGDLLQQGDTDCLDFLSAIRFSFITKSRRMEPTERISTFL